MTNKKDFNPFAEWEVTDAADPIAEHFDDDSQIDDNDPDDGSKKKELTPEEKAAEKARLAAEKSLEEFGSDNDEDEDENNDEDDDENDDNDSNEAADDDDNDLDDDKKKKLKLFEDLGLYNPEDEVPENIEEYLSEKIEEANEKYFEEQTASLPPVVKNLNKFVLNGGSPDEFIDSIVEQRLAASKKNFDINTEKGQEEIVKAKLREDQYDDEYINAHIEFLKSSNKLEVVARKNYVDHSKREKELQDAAVKKQVEAEKNRKKKLVAYRNDIASFVQEKTDFVGITLSPADKRSIPAYMANPAYKLDNGQTITQMQKDISELMSDPETGVAFAKLVKEKLNLKKIKRSNYGNNNTRKTTKKKKKAKKSLADYF